jgi:hypothetical protein
MHHIKISASPNQLSKLRNGHKVRIVKGEGCNLIVHPENYSIVSRAFAKNKGVNVQLSPQEIAINKQYSYLSPEEHAKQREQVPSMANIPPSEGKGIFKAKGGKLSPAVAGLQKVGEKYGPKIIEKVIDKGIDRALGGALHSSLLKVQGGLNKVGSPFERSVGVNPATLGFDLGNEVIGPALYQSIYGHPRGYGISVREALKHSGVSNLTADEALDKFEQASILARRQLEPYQHYMHNPLEPRSRGQGAPNFGGRNSVLATNYLPQALIPQPLSSNFHMQYFLPPQYQQHFTEGSGLYAGRGGSGLYT